MYMFSLQVLVSFDLDLDFWQSISVFGFADRILKYRKYLENITKALKFGVCYCFKKQ